MQNSTLTKTDIFGLTTEDVTVEDIPWGPSGQVVVLLRGLEWTTDG